MILSVYQTKYTNILFFLVKYTCHTLLIQLAQHLCNDLYSMCLNPTGIETAY